MPVIRGVRGLALGLGLILRPFDAAAQTELVDAREVLARYRSALGTKERLSKRTHAQLTGEIGGSFYQQFIEFPRRFMTNMTLDNYGTFRSGFSGLYLWSYGRQGSAQVELVDDVTSMSVTRETALDAAVFPDSLIKTAQTVLVRRVGRQECYQVNIVWASGPPSNHCFSLKDSLLLRSSVSSEGRESETYYEGYKVFEGLKVPTKIRSRYDGKDIATTNWKVVTFLPFPASFIDPPSEVIALAATKAAERMPPMVNADVVQMVSSGLSDQLVVNAIQLAKRTSFDVSVAGMVALKQSKVSDAVISAMQAAGQAVAQSGPMSSAAASAVTPPSPAAQSSRFVGTWRFASGRDGPDFTFPRELVISRNGDQFLVKFSNDKTPSGAVYRDGMLVMSGVVELTYVEATGRLLLGFYTGAEYEKVK